MASSKQASLILQLIDKVSGPAKGIVGSLNLIDSAVRGFTGAAMAPARAIAGAGRAFRRHSSDVAGASVPLALGLGKAAEAVYGFEKAGNRMQAFGLLNDEQRERLEDEAQFLNKLFPQTNKGILEAAGELFRAGLTYEQALGALKGTLQLSLAGDIATDRAADIATNIMYAMKLPMKTYEQVQASLQRVNDMLAYGATKSNTDIGLMSDTFRYVAPLAAVAGMEIEEVTALTMELAKAGIKGAEAGVALRSALVRMAKPTKPMFAAFNRLGIKMEDFVQYKERIEASTISGSLLAEGYDLRDLSGEIQAILDDKSLAGAPQRMVAQLSDLIVGSIGDEAVRDNISQALTDAVAAGAQNVDLVKLLGTLRDKGATITDIAQIFDVRMGSRLAAILFSDLDAVIDQVREGHGGTSAKLSALMMGGIVGSFEALAAAVENLSIMVARSGVLETVSKALEQTTAFLGQVSKANPQLLEMGTYGTMALAAMAPLGLALSGTASALALMVNPLSWVVAGLGYLAYQNWDSLLAFGQGFKLGFLDNIDPNTMSQVAGWLTEINVALSDQGAMGASGNWFGAKVAGEINAFVRDIAKLKAEIQGLVDWWNGKGESPIQLQAGDGPMGDFWRNLGNMDTGTFLRNYLLPDAWNPDKIDEYIAKTRSAGQEAEQNLNIVATPIVDSSSIDTALSKASALRRMLEGMDALGRRGGGGGSSAPASGGFGGPRAEGGPVKRGLTYLVGEEGPELFSPGRSGGITPNHALGGGGGGPLIGDVHIHGASANEVMAKLGATLDRALERSRQLSLDDRPVTT